MAVVLRQSRDLAGTDGLAWIALSVSVSTLDPAYRRNGLAKRLELAFEAIRDRWYALAHAHAGDPGAAFSTTLTCAPTISDLGLMLAWTRIVGELAAEPAATAVLCDDPWLFRHLAGLPGVSAGRPPALWPARLRLAARGLAARAALCLRLARAVFATRAQRGHHRSGGSFLLVYGHPGSKGDGFDAYFGPLPQQTPALGRLLHTDCLPGRAAELVADGRTASLHAWGRLAWLPALLFTRWRPRPAASDPWLLARAAIIEGSTAMAATTRWQNRCQRAWLEAMRPRAVAWPWENHCWERDFVQAARRLGVKTIGYQHTVVGRHMYNQSPRISPLGATALPDRLLANGPATRADLAAAGVPEDRLAVIGATRLAEAAPLPYDPAAPVFVALSHDEALADQQMRAVRLAAAAGRWRFLVKDHPMYPFAFAEDERVRRTDLQLQKQQAVSAVFVCTGAVGLEALLGGLPTIRLVPDGLVAQDVLPAALKAVEIEGDGLAEALGAARPPAPVRWDEVLAPPDFDRWRAELEVEA